MGHKPEARSPRSFLVGHKPYDLDLKDRNPHVWLDPPGHDDTRHTKLHSGRLSDSQGIVRTNILLDGLNLGCGVDLVDSHPKSSHNSPARGGAPLYQIGCFWKSGRNNYSSRI